MQPRRDASGKLCVGRRGRGRRAAAISFGLSPDQARPPSGARGPRSSGRYLRTAQAPRSVCPGLDPVLLVLQVVARPCRRSPLAASPSTRPFVVGLVGRVRHARSGRARWSRHSRRPAGWWAPRRTRPSPARWPRPMPCDPSTCTCSWGAWRLGMIIQVSDQPVEPSSGEHRRDRPVLALQQVRHELPRRADDDVARGVRGHLVGVGAPVEGAVVALLLSSRSIAAWNCASLSWYGFLIPRSGCVVMRCSAASAM